MDSLLFGTGGVPNGSSGSSTVAGIERIAELGLGCMEVEFVQGVRMSEGGARLVAEAAQKKGIKLSAHAPYFINFNANEPEKVKSSQQRLLQTARIGYICGVQSAIVHTAFYLNDSPEETYDTVKKYLKETLDQLKKEKNPVVIRPEVMGKPSEFGTVEEILRLCGELEGLGICIDFAHWHAMHDKANTYDDFASVLKQVEKRLGRAALENMHFHVSGIKYGAKGEIKHLNLKASDMPYVELLRALKDNRVKGLVICESPNLEEDALLLQETYSSLQ